MPQHQQLLQLAYQLHGEKVSRADKRRAEHRTRAEIAEPRPTERRVGYAVRRVLRARTQGGQ
jgi:hypothetical protein